MDLAMPIQLVVPGSPAKGEYRGPGWPEWLLGFGCTILAGTQLRSITTVPDPQTALSYYFQEPFVRAFHASSLGIDFLVVLTVAAWIFLWQKSEAWGALTLALCLGGAALGWAELIRATVPTPGRVYLLQGLPFSPVNNGGIAGTTLFAGYATTKIPLGTLTLPAKILLRIAACLGLFVAQWIVFEQIAALTP